MFQYFIKAVLIFFVILIVGLLIPQNLVIPVEGATKSDYNSKSFWYYPWGKSVTHKGIDIFAKKGTKVVSSTCGIVLLTGNMEVGGNFVVTLGPKWRLHYYAHLNKINTRKLSFVKSGENIGTVGNTGNAITTPPHLHYSIGTLIPYFLNIDNSRQGWKKSFYLNPIDFIEK